jgi:pentatricopeptide repeat protein
MYTVAGRYAEALYWAERCVARCEAERIGDFDLAYAYEAMVRALALLGRVEDARSWFAKMQTAALDIVKDGDREWFEKDVASLGQLI